MSEHAADTATSPPGGRRRFTGLEFNAIALMASTGITALVGLGFWAIAARLPAAEVGRTAAILSAATMLSQIASSNVGVLFGRVLAGAGAKARRIVLAGYGAATVIGLVLGVGFVLIYAGDTLFASNTERLLFPGLVVLFCLFSLQDWVLIGVRASGWVPVEQLLFSVAKLGLLLWFSAQAVTSGIVWAWAIPCLLTVLVINPILLLRVLPGRRAPADATPLPDRRALVSIFLAEYATGTVTVVIPLVLPLLVIGILGREANAYYALPWLIAESLSLLMWNISSSYVVEASHDRREQAALMRRTFRLSFLVSGLGVPFLLITAPWLLSFLGRNYAAHGSTVLRLMVLAIPFTVINLMYINTARVRNLMGRIVALELLTAAVVIVLAVDLMPRIGIDGSGWAYLSAQALAAALTIVPVVRALRGGRDEPAGKTTRTRPLPVTPSLPITAALPVTPSLPITAALPISAALPPSTAHPVDPAGPVDMTRPMTVVTRGPRP